MFEEWMSGSAGPLRAQGVSQLYVESTPSFLAMTKVTDDILLAGKLNEVKMFFTTLRKQSEIRKFVVDDFISFNGCNIRKDNDGFVTVKMETNLRDIRFIELVEDRWKQRTMKVNENGLRAFRALCGELV